MQVGYRIGGSPQDWGDEDPFVNYFPKQSCRVRVGGSPQAWGDDDLARCYWLSPHHRRVLPPPS